MKLDMMQIFLSALYLPFLLLGTEIVSPPIQLESDNSVLGQGVGCGTDMDCARAGGPSRIISCSWDLQSQ